MRSLLTATFFFLSFLSAIPLQAQTAADVNEGARMTQNATTGQYTFSWWGRSGRTYFVQQSEDMVHWSYLPLIESGGAAVTEYGFTSSAPRFFLRLRHTNAATGGNPDTADFDGDELSNAEELNTYHTDPLAADTDGDSFGDGFEVLKGTNPLNALDSPLTLAQQQLASLQTLVAYYKGLLAAGTLSIDDLSYEWGGVSVTAAQLLQLLNDAYGVTTDPGALGGLDGAYDGLDGALDDAGEDPGAPPIIVEATQDKHVWNWWYSTSLGSGGNLYGRMTGTYYVAQEGYYPAAWITTLSQMIWPDEITLFNSSIAGSGDSIAYYDSQFGGSGDNVEVKISRMRLLAGKPVTADVTRTYIRVLHTFDFRTEQEIPDQFLGVDSVTIAEGGKASGTVFIDAPVLEDGSRKTISLRAIALVSSATVVLPGQKVSVQLQLPALPAGVSISGFYWSASGVVFKDYQADNKTAHLITWVDRSSSSTEFYWADTGQKSVSVSYIVSDGTNSWTCESSMIVQVVKPISLLAAVKRNVVLSATGNGAKIEAPGTGFTAYVASVADRFETEGQFQLVQRVQDGGLYTKTNDQVMQGNHYQEWVLDTFYPAAGPALTGHVMTFADPPETPFQSDAKKHETHDHFEMYLMFKPPGIDTKWVPLKVIPWEWSFNATKAGGVWTLNSGDSSVPATGVVTSQHPRWDANYFPSVWVPKPSP